MGEIRGSYGFPHAVTQDITERLSSLPLLRDCYVSVADDSHEAAKQETLTDDDFNLGAEQHIIAEQQ